MEYGYTRINGENAVITRPPIVRDRFEQWGKRGSYKTAIVGNHFEQNARGRAF
jgi:hypothetical protein